MLDTTTVLVNSKCFLGSYTQLKNKFLYTIGALYMYNFVGCYNSRISCFLFVIQQLSNLRLHFYLLYKTKNLFFFRSNK